VQSKFSTHALPRSAVPLLLVLLLGPPLEDEVPETPDDDVDPDELDPRGPSPFVVDEQPMSRSVNTTVDFIPERLPC
jgi:hypothetical protein